MEQRYAPLFDRGFNPSQVGYKREFRGRRQASFRKQFQSLVGRLQTCLKVKFQKKMRWAVSIPRRQATNNIDTQWSHIQHNEFQSLVGRLQTSTIVSLLHLPCLFQSLVGRLQTSFLRGQMPPFIFPVSIPRRQATNDNNHWDSDFAREECFNPSQVGYKLTVIPSLPSKFPRVSIPRRQATNTLLCHFVKFRFLFQSLVGRLQTEQEEDGKVMHREFQSLVGRLQTLCVGHL